MCDRRQLLGPRGAPSWDRAGSSVAPPWCPGRGDPHAERLGVSDVSLMQRRHEDSLQWVSGATIAIVT